MIGCYGNDPEDQIKQNELLKYTEDREDRDIANYKVSITVSKIPADKYEEICNLIEERLDELGLYFDFGLGEEDDN